MSPRVTIIGVTYNHGRKLRIFLDSLLEQTSREWKLILLHDGAANEETREIVAGYDGDLTFIETRERFNDFGHSLRAMGLAKTETEFLNWQNCDNYLTPKFVEMLLAAATKETLDFIYCDILHSYGNVNFDGQGEYNVLNSYPVINRMDIANFFVKTELAKKVGFNHRVSYADGLFIAELMAAYGPEMRVGKVQSCLLVHN